jgi:hypothetical protein
MRMRTPIAIGAFSFLAALVVTTAAHGEDPERSGPPSQSFEQTVRPLVQQYCLKCHGDNPKADVALDGSWNVARVRNDRDTWERVFDMLDGREMPPKEMPQPTDDQRRRALEWLQATLFEAKTVPDPGCVTLRRLNRAQYGNTIRDLLGVEFDAAEDFPADDVGYGFDNIGDVLSLPPILMEKYLAAAEEIAARAIVVDPLEASPARRLGADGLQGGASGGDRRVLASQGEVYGSFDASAEGEYLIRVTACGDQAGDEPAKAELRVDGEKRKLFDVAAVAAEPKVYEYRSTLPAGRRRVAVAFVNDYYNPAAADPGQRDRNLAVLAIELVGPLVERPEDYPESHRRIIFVRPGKDVSPTEAAGWILRRLATRAFRRPATDEEIERLSGLVAVARDEGDSFEGGIRLALEAILCSPHFLFMVPRDPEGSREARPLDEYELAERMSYFLWSSMPDEELFECAAQGTLRANLDVHVRRMLEDSKSESLVENFAEQWFQLRNLDLVTPDTQQFSTFDDRLRGNMATETRMFFAEIVREDRSLLDLIDGDFTYLNERL